MLRDGETLTTFLLFAISIWIRGTMWAWHGRVITKTTEAPKFSTIPVPLATALPPAVNGLHVHICSPASGQVVGPNLYV